MTRRARNSNGNGQVNPPRDNTETGLNCEPLPNPARIGHAPYGEVRIGRHANAVSFQATFMAFLALTLMTLPLSQTEAGYASIVIDTQSGAVLHETNADTQNYPASLVKMMTLYLTFEALTRHRLQLDQRFEVSRRAVDMAPSRLGLRVGQRIRAEEAILALVTKSANDAAVVLAEALGGSEHKFAKMMNDKARELGLTRTTFRNASGLPDRGQVSTARDMATLGRALLRDFPQYYRVFSVTDFRYGDRTYHNHNRLLESYSGADGIKTGYTRASGFNLAASVKRGEHRLIAVVFGGETAKSRDQHMVELLDRAFARINTVTNLASLNAPPSRDVIQASAQNSLAQQDQDTGKAGASTGR